MFDLYDTEVAAGGGGSGDVLYSELASTVAGKGADYVGLNNSASYFNNPAHVRDALEQLARAVTPVWRYGNYGPGETAAVNTATVQAGIDALTADGGVLLLGAGEVELNKITLKKKVILEGINPQTTKLKAANNLNDDFIVGEDFATLTGSNKWLTSQGVPYAFGLRNLALLGNRANQTSGTRRGLVVYGKQFYIQNVIITDFEGNGFYSECGAAGGQNDITDMPEGVVTNLWIKGCYDHGWLMRGPHDQKVGNLYILDCRGTGFKNEASATYNGACDISFAHIYSNSVGIDLGSTTKAGILISESNSQEGMLFNTTDYMISALELFLNNRDHHAGAPANIYEAIFEAGADFGTVTNISIRNMQADKSGIHVKAKHVDMTSVKIDGNGAGKGIVFEAGANHNMLRANISGFSGVGGVGLELNANGSCQNNTIVAHFGDCETFFENNAGGVRENLRLTGFAETGQSYISGTTNPNSDDGAEWHIGFTGNGQDPKRTKFKDSLNLNFHTTGEKNISFTHNLIGTPRLEDVQLSFYQSNTLMADVAATAWVESVTATTIDCVVSVTNADSANGLSGKLICKAEM